MRRNIIGALDPTGRAIAYGSVTVTQVATKIPTTNLTERKAISIRNYSNNNIFLGGNNSVTTSTGYPLLPYESLPMDVNANANIYGICETGKTAVVKYIEIDNN